MKKLIVASVMGLLIVLGTCAQAQFFRGGKMMRAPKPKIHKSFVRVPKPTKRPGCRVSTMQPPKRIPAGGKAPAVSINKTTVERAVAEKVAQQTAAPQASVKPFAGRDVYDSQAELAYDVAVFYEGNGVQGKRLQDPFGREYSLYELPQEEIRFQPVGTNTPRVLSAQEYVVIYSMDRNAGELVKKDSPQMRFFQPKVEE